MKNTVMKTALRSKRGYDIPLTAAIDGAEALCLVIHGFGSSKESPTATFLLEEFPKRGIGVAALDLPAHGESPMDGEYLRIANCLADIGTVDAWLGSQCPEKEIFYFGSSFGAYLALLYLAGVKSAGKKAFLRSAAVCMPDLMRELAPKEKESLAAQGYVELGSDYGYFRPLKLTRGFFEDLDENDVFSIWRPEYGELAMIHGEADEEVPVAEATRFAEKFAVPITVVPGGDHRLSIPGAQDLVLARALEFFGSLQNS